MDAYRETKTAPRKRKPAPRRTRGSLTRETAKCLNVGLPYRSLVEWIGCAMDRYATITVCCKKIENFPTILVYGATSFRKYYFSQKTLGARKMFEYIAWVVSGGEPVDAPKRVRRSRVGCFRALRNFECCTFLVSSSMCELGATAPHSRPSPWPPLSPASQ